MPYTLENLETYILAEELGEKIWIIVELWDNFSKFSIGSQIVRSADSVSANIAEGYGRYFIKENIQFCFYSRGSLLETKNWVTKAGKRNLLTKEQEQDLFLLIEKIHAKLNGYIKVLKTNQSNK